MKIILFVLGCFIVVFSKKSLRLWTLVIFLIPMLLLTYWYSRNIDYPFSILMLFSIVFLDIDEVCRGFLVGMVSGVIFVLLLFVIGVLPDVVQVRAGVTRHSFGFSLPLILPALYFCICSAFLYSRRRIYTMKSLFFLFLFQLPIYYFCDGRGPLILTTILLMGAAALRHSSSIKLRKFFMIMGLIMLFLALILSIYIAKKYNVSNKYLNELNQNLTGRPQWWNLYWNMYHPKLFGQQIIRVGGATAIENTSIDLMILDNGYLSILLEYGIVSLIFFLLINVITLIRFYQSNDVMGLLILILWIIYGIVTNQIYFIDRNIILIIAAFAFKNYSVQQEVRLYG
ncbi:hypothetical protein [Lapidilactobacillus dextrinicus]|uniref:hypothetical protein n=1 Tax=Lapidilactobacillus dextrinicus TaxID=51664 RepID=UPI003F249101